MSLAPVADQFRRSDLRFWGAIAGTSCALAVVSAALPALLPSQFFASLHSTRLSRAISNPAGARAQLQHPPARAGSTGAGTPRLAMLEPQLPKMLATLPAAGAIDTSSFTDGINPVEHGFSGSAVPAAATSFVPVTTQPMPAPLVPTPPAGAATPAALPAAPTAPSRTPPATRETAAAPALHPTPSTARPLAATAAGSATTAGSAEAVAAARLPDMSVSAARQAPAVTDIASTAPSPSATDAASRRAPVDTVVPLPRPALPAPNAAEQPSAKANAQEIGIAVGAPVQPGNAMGAWQDLAAKIGVMLVGTTPLLADDPGGSAGKVLVAGPIPGIAKAAALCAEVNGAGITCTPMPYVGTDLPPAANP